SASGTVVPCQPVTVSTRAGPSSAMSPLGLYREEPTVDGLREAPIDGIDGPLPVTHVERPELDPVGLDRRARRHRLRIDDEAAGHERCVKSAQGVHDALELDASQRPAADRQIEATAR